MSPEEKAIAGYKIEQKMILDAIDAAGGKLTEMRFDEIFNDFEIKILPDGTTVRERRVPCPLEFMSTDRESIVLVQNGGRLGKFIHLVQLMVEAGIVKSVEEMTHVVYSRA